ncbi:hypothetical protein [Viridibacterium curvum]|uniref:Uncharacterized protein n=1 Tax=Viridibacterium curvum TaxID=1101404 RepID=A0ABP9QMR4_9RHOO
MAARTLRTRWQALRANTHVCTECNVLIFLLMAVGAAIVGLHVAPIVFGLLAIVLGSTDAYEWWHERRR